LKHTACGAGVIIGLDRVVLSSEESIFVSMLGWKPFPDAGIALPRPGGALSVDTTKTERFGGA
jgi:hypothetical protein